MGSHDALHVACCLLRGVCCMVYVACRMLPVACCCCLLHGVCCMSSVARGCTGAIARRIALEWRIALEAVEAILAKYPRSNCPTRQRQRARAQETRPPIPNNRPSTSGYPRGDPVGCV